MAALLLYKCIAVGVYDKPQILHRLIYFCAVIIAVMSCVYRARERNLDWRNDEALFRSSLGVCPRSAKLQLQVGFIVPMNQTSWTLI